MQEWQKRRKLECDQYELILGGINALNWRFAPRHAGSGPCSLDGNLCPFTSYELAVGDSESYQVIMNSEVDRRYSAGNNGEPLRARDMVSASRSSSLCNGVHLREKAKRDQSVNESWVFPHKLHPFYLTFFAYISIQYNRHVMDI